MFKIFLIIVIIGGTSAYSDEMPLGAKSGQCFTKTFYPPKFKKTTRVKEMKKVILNDESVNYEVIPAKFFWEDKRVQVSDIKENILVTPAIYKTVYKQVLVEPSEKYWRRGLSPNSPKAFNSCIKSASSFGMDVDNAEIGTCFYEHYKPKKYITTTEKILTSEPSERVVVIPAKYKVSRKKVLIDSTTERLIPSVSTYKRVNDKVTIEPAHTEWRKTTCQDRGCNQSEVVCLIEVPVKYREVVKKIVLEAAVKKRVSVSPKYKVLKVEEMLSPASEKRIAIPAKYKRVLKTEKIEDEEYFWTDSLGKNSATRLTSECNKICLTKTTAKYKKIAKRVVVTPASSRKIIIPKKYTFVKVKNIYQKASFKKRVIPSEYISIVTEKERTKGYAKWMPMVCEEMLTPKIIRQVQQALKFQGFYNGVVDGIWSLESKTSIRAYQKSKGLGLTSKLSIETMISLGIY